MAVRVFLLIIVFSLIVQFVCAQLLQPLHFKTQPVLEHGIAVEPYALFYRSPSGDTTESIREVAQQRFISSVLIPGTKFIHNRQMKRTTQVIWLQFQIANQHSSDTLRLWYAGGVHAYLSLYLKDNNSFSHLGDAGMCTVESNQPLGKYAMSLKIPPLTTNHYFIKVVDHLLLFEDVAGAIHTSQSYQSSLLAESNAVRWLFFVISMIIGCLLFMSLYSFYQFYLNLDKAFLFYALYAALAFLWILKFANPRFELGLTPASLPWLAHPWSFSFSHILSLAYALFLINLLSIPQEQPKLWQIIRPLMVLLFILQVLVGIQLFTGILIPSAPMFFIIDTVPSLCMGVLLIIATLRSRSRLKPYLLAGGISLYVISLSPIHGIFLVENASPQVYAFVNYPPFFMALGLFIELFCFSLALAYRNKLVEDEKNTMQKHYTSQLESDLSQRTKEIREKSRKLEEQQEGSIKLAYEQKLAEMEMTALRAQMNPHFIFNCLNSIKLYTTDNEAAKASAYITKFSRLIRLVLENSRSEKVTLKNELDALDLYLQMEAMRFKDKLNFTIDVDTEIDTGNIEIPPMLLQPYVENAIWHGLMHKKEGGNVRIRLIKLQSDCLQVTITDDGIGRIKSASLKSKSVLANKSFGMKVTNERISLINQLYQTHTKVQVNDLIDNEGTAAGTEVVLEIPI